MPTVKNVVLKAMIDDNIQELMIKTDATNVYVDGSTLADKLTDIIERLTQIESQLGSSTVTPTTTILRENYSPSGSSWTDTVTLNFSNGDYVEASIDLTNCTESYENILSVGDSISTWGQTTGGFHLYYTQNSNLLQINSLVGTTNTRTNVTLSSTTVVIKISSDGIYIDDTLKSTNAQIVSHTSTQIGSVEGNTRSNATYNYIKVVTY